MLSVTARTGPSRQPASLRRRPAGPRSGRAGPGPRWWATAALALSGGLLVAAPAEGATSRAPAVPVAPSVPRAAPLRPVDNPGVVGLALGGGGASLVPPTSPTLRPYGPDCAQLVDPGFSGRCLVASGPRGTVAGVVEVLLAAETSQGRAQGHRAGPGSQERDLVWRRQGSHWALALRRVFQSRGLLTQLYASARPDEGTQVLLFISPSAAAHYGQELDIVSQTGQVELRRFLGQGFVVVPPQGGLVTYVPGWAEQSGPSGAYDQTFIRDLDGLWTIVAEQYVPDGAALAMHQGTLSYQQALR